MSVRKTLSTAVLATFLALSGLFAAAPAASAHETPCCTWKLVTSYECRHVPYQVCVTRYDHCGHPYHAYETRYRTVHVPVQKYVKVCY